MVKQRNLNFHQTFPPESEYLGRILNIADLGKAFTKEEISSLTGIPTGKSSGKVEPHIKYAEYMGLINDVKFDGGKHKLELTSLGKIVYKEDVGFQEDLTLLLCHCMLARKNRGAELWAYIVKDLFPRYRYHVKKEIFEEELKRQFSNTLKTAPFFSSYNGMFQRLSFIVQNAIEISCNPILISNDFIYVYALALYFDWNESFSEQHEISADQLALLRFSSTFGWNDEQEYSVLESMADYGIVRMNRQLSPYTILRIKSMDELIKLLYSELC